MPETPDDTPVSLTPVLYRPLTVGDVRRSLLHYPDAAVIDVRTPDGLEFLAHQVQRVNAVTLNGTAAFPRLLVRACDEFDDGVVELTRAESPNE